MSCETVSVFHIQLDSEAPVEGQVVERISEIKQLCVDAHEKLCPKVPLCGWDVALTRDNGMLLLEVRCVKHSVWSLLICWG